jgi:hypothetical protein
MCVLKAVDCNVIEIPLYYTNIILNIQLFLLLGQIFQGSVALTNFSAMIRLASV